LLRAFDPNPALPADALRDTSREKGDHLRWLAARFDHEIPVRVIEVPSAVGKPRGRDAYAALDMNFVHELRNAGFSARQIAAYLGVSVLTIKRRLAGR